MTDDINLIRKAISYEVISAMGDEGVGALLTVDDLLACMAVPATQFDFSYVDRGGLKNLMVEERPFAIYKETLVDGFSCAPLEITADKWEKIT